MRDVFDTTGHPPAGWMHAVFDGGPYAEDVGRCVPEPPPDLVDAGDAQYRIVQVLTMSWPDHVLALYACDGREPYTAVGG